MSIRMKDVKVLRKISLITIFAKSIYSPKEIAKYRFLTIGKSIQYVFILALFLSLAGFYDAIFQQDFTAGYGHTASDTGTKVLFAALVVLMAFILNSGLAFLSITILAVIGEPIAKALGRKLPYRQSWRLTACSTTLPVVLFSLLNLFHFDQPYFILLALIMAVVIIIVSIKAIPKPRKKS
ncbi:motility protein [Bacillus freudenreichii]|nr:motility protein [Bacillus freudenreichii]